MNPDAYEIDDNGVDDDCDGIIDDGVLDGDGDGYTEDGGDCDAGEPNSPRRLKAAVDDPCLKN